MFVCTVFGRFLRASAIRMYCVGPTRTIMRVPADSYRVACPVQPTGTGTRNTDLWLISKS
jgi:hypothetical protein